MWSTMLRYILWRLLVMIPTLLIISAVVFTIITLPPGDYFESYVAVVASERRSGRSERDRGPPCRLRIRQTSHSTLLFVARRPPPWRFRLFVCLSAPGLGRHRRPPLAHDRSFFLH